MNTKKKYEIGVERFHELMLKAESQGLTALFTDSHVCNVLFDMWPEDTAELGGGATLTLFDTHYSDKTGPSINNELLDLGTIDEPLCGPIVAEEVGGRIIAIEVAEGLVHRDYWELLERMKDVAREKLKPPAFANASDLEEFMDRCDDVNTCYIHEFDAYKGIVGMDTDDGGSIGLWLGDLINEGLLKNPGELDKWAPWLRQDLKTIDRVIEENANPPIKLADIEMYDFSSDGEVVLRYEL